LSLYKINPEILQEINLALHGLKERIIQADDNIDEVCAKINANRPEGPAWTIIHCYPAAEEEDLVLIQSLIEGKDYILEVSFNHLTNDQGPST
jgi:hypothetical protein